MKKQDVILKILHEMHNIFPHKRNMCGLEDFSEKEINHAKRIFNALQDFGVIADDSVEIGGCCWFEGWESI
jgi:hypothetical protein